MSSFQPNWVSKPGNTILDILKERNITTESFVEQMRQPADCIHRLIYGEAAITSTTASQLTKVLGASEQFWLNRQLQYQESLVAVNKLDEEKWLKAIPFKEMVNLGWIKDTSNKLEACLKFFGIQTIDDWIREYKLGIAGSVSFRTSPTFKSQLGPLTCWLRQGEIIGNAIDCKLWDSSSFRASLSQIRQLTKEKNPRRFIPKLISLCADSGVAVAIVRAPQGCKASGATKFLSNGRALLMLSFRYLSDDQFWFTFFHEAGHLLLHEGKGIFVEGLESEAGVSEINVQERESEANDFAVETLIPPHLRGRLSKLKGNKRDIISFAIEAGISSGIVVGQMQHYGYISRSYLNVFKRRYNWEDILSV
ncbi:ImmA/IrrE family metallo-endopeptidase [Larkinella rosea]|uniref:ImmA/IrrE family metallo-endopeptidase n=1 Tax=Larkinella rosea TaxID=2025312 RepID=A0A3P1BE52_9BACT|nr:ImmA/IrrE family metallo-endopeptidase [Larkinella rosea]RRA99215.1 ImmA/IrrE family metallo-endopeptidase [Larkinella rosea]